MPSNIIKWKVVAATLTSPSTRSCNAKIAVLNPSVGWSTYIACVDRCHQMLIFFKHKIKIAQWDQMRYQPEDFADAYDLAFVVTASWIPSLAVCKLNYKNLYYIQCFLYVACAKVQTEMQFPSQPAYPTLTLVRTLLSGNRQLSKAFESKVQTPANKVYHDTVRFYCPNVPNQDEWILWKEEVATII